MNKIFKKSLIVVGLSILIMNILSGCGKEEEKESIVTFNCNYSKGPIMAEVDENLLREEIENETMILFKAKDNSNQAYISIIVSTLPSTPEECLNTLKAYKTNLEEDYKITEVSESTSSNGAFKTYQLFDSKGNIITVYTKAISKDENTLIVSYFSGYSDNEDLNVAFKTTFDSLTLK